MSLKIIRVCDLCDDTLDGELNDSYLTVSRDLESILDIEEGTDICEICLKSIRQVVQEKVTEIAESNL